MRWMNALQALVGEISINWTVAAMYYDQGMPVQAAFQKLIVKEEKKVKSFKEYAYPKRENYVKKEQKVVDGPQPHWDNWDYKEWEKQNKGKK